jgi:hypothetical protein
VHAEADQAEREHRRQTGERAGQRTQPLAALACPEHEERQREPGRDLHAGGGGQRGRGRAQPRGPSAGESQRERHQHDQQGVVVRSSHRQHEQHRVQANERRCARGGVPEVGGRPRAQGDRREAREDGDGLHRPQAAGQAERGRGVAGEREQWAIGGVLERPADERVGGVVGRFGREARVGVEAVQRAHAREVEVAEHVLGEQRRPEQQYHVGEHDRPRQRPHAELARAEQHEQVARADREHQRLEAARAEGVQADSRQRAGQPARPAADVRGHELPRAAGGGRYEQEQARQQRQQREGAKAAERGGIPRAPGGHARSDGDGRCRGRRLDGSHSGVWTNRQASMHPGRLYPALRRVEPPTPAHPVVTAGLRAC